MIKSAIQFFRQLCATFAPRTLLVGTAVGFGAMCLLGYQTTRQDYHRNWLRFTRWTSPETKYYATVNELMAIVRDRVRPGQVLVIVGGNSVMRGVGQPPDQVWTKRLQENLGDGYCVLNLAFNGSGITDGAAVVAEALRAEYPRQIYIANAAPASGAIPDGTGVYRFVYWDAYYKGLLIDDPARTTAIAELHKIYPYSVGMTELGVREWLDQWFYFQDLWNSVTFTKVNTVWGFYMPGLTQFLQPRKRYPDPEPDFLTMPLSVRYLEANLEAEMINVRGCSVYAYNKDAEGRWQPYAPVWDQFTQNIKVAMPRELRKRTLVLLSRNSPYYIRRLPADEQQRDDLAYLEAVRLWKQNGYDSMDYGKDFTIDDYGDRTHLTWHGGIKLSKLVADKIRDMSQNLGYLEKK